jgi:precorrin-6B C5,15-methyltransferase / cobalt-precorrin-6B C5,C15-methyltransferase
VKATEQWLSILGMGEGGWDDLSAAAKHEAACAERLYGGARHLAFVPEAVSAAMRIAWPSPMAQAVEEILTEHRGKTRIAVLASGDPMLHGVGVRLTRDLAVAEFRVIPQVSAFSLACARLGWPVAETTLLSLVNRPAEQVLRHLYPGQRLVLFSEDGSTPARVARLLTENGYGASRFHVLENLGGARERGRSGEAASWPEERCGKLNLIAVHCAAAAQARMLSLAPGLPDDVFESDGQLTKREVRAITLAQLAPAPHQTLWDVGAGSGSVGIEWMRAHPTCGCIAFEARADRAARIRRNAAQLGVPALEVIEATAPAAFAGMRAPERIFLGGSVDDDCLFDACWAALAQGGRLVANAVTVASECRLAARHARYGGELVRMMIARADPLGDSLGWRPMMPITQWIAVKR